MVGVSLPPAGIEGLGLVTGMLALWPQQGLGQGSFQANGVVTSQEVGLDADHSRIVSVHRVEVTW